MSNDKWLEGAQEVQATWFKFDNVGDRIKGTLLGSDLKQGDGEFPDQMVYKIKTDEGAVYNVGISVHKAGTIDRLNLCKKGEIIGILYEKDGEPTKKGYAAPKFLKVFSFGMDESFDEFSGGTEINPEDVEY